MGKNYTILINHLAEEGVIKLSDPPSSLAYALKKHFGIFLNESGEVEEESYRIVRLLGVAT